MLSANELRDLGWQSVALNEFIVKIHSRCNLHCDYCYIYAMGDTSWQNQPASMTPSVARQVAYRIRQHVEKHELTNVAITLHGGEPLLVPPKRLEELLDIFSNELETHVSLHFSMQTNGLLLTDDVLELLSNYNVTFGVSLDGGEIANDRHRTTKAGKGSYAAVSERLHALLSSDYSYLFAGLLATINIENDPIDVYRDLRAFNPLSIDFLLPHGNWSEPPPHKSLSSAPYGEWLVALFDHWFDSPQDEPHVRLFNTIIRLALGDSSVAFESFGLAPVRLAVIETDGSYELVDVMKSAYNGAAMTGLDIFNHDLDAVLEHPSVAIRQCGEKALCSTCQSCTFLAICGGGYYPHRYRKGSGFLNPSVFCEDLKHLYSHVVTRVRSTESV